MITNNKYKKSYCFGQNFVYYNIRLNIKCQNLIHPAGISKSPHCITCQEQHRSPSNMLELEYILSKQNQKQFNI